MLIGLLLLLFITLICWGWGLMTAKVLQLTKSEETSPSINAAVICVLGALTILLIANAISFFLPLSTVYIQSSLTLIALVSIYFNRKSFTQFKWQPKKAARIDYFLLLPAFIMLLLLLQHHSSAIVHPDTLSYHAAIIHWIEQYPQVPGIANLESRLGLQSNWFVGSAIFSFENWNIRSIGFLNLAMLSWFIWYLLVFIAAKVKNQQYASAFIALLLLGWSWLNFSQIRLTASSASPDFIAIFLILFIIHISLQVKSENIRRNLPLIVFLSFSATAIKFSVFPILLLPAFITFQYFKTSIWLFLKLSICCAIFILAPLLTRNYIASGYPLYPSSLFAVSQPDWRISESKQEYDYKNITAYARVKNTDDISSVNQAYDADLAEWLPVWWSQKTTVDKTFLIALGILLLAGLLKIRSTTWKSNWPILLTLAVGILFWFLIAPDLRFGYGFLYALMGWLLIQLLSSPTKAGVLSGAIAILILVLPLSLATLSAYRFVNHFNQQQWLYPMGIANTEYQTTQEGIHIPVAPCNCGSAPPPCSCQPENVTLRGTDIKEGFKSK